MSQSIDRDLRFQLNEIELELKLAVTEDMSGSLGAKLWVVNFDAGGSRKVEQLQTLKLKLQPQVNGGLAIVNKEADTLGQPVTSR